MFSFKDSFEVYMRNVVHYILNRSLPVSKTAVKSLQHFYRSTLEIYQSKISWSLSIIMKDKQLWEFPTLFLPSYNVKVRCNAICKLIEANMSDLLAMAVPYKEMLLEFWNSLK